MIELTPEFNSASPAGETAWEYKRWTDDPTQAIPSSSQAKPQSYQLAGIPVFKLYYDLPRYDLPFPLPHSPAAAPDDWARLGLLLHYTLGPNQLLNLPGQAAVHGNGLRGESHISSLIRRSVPSGGALYPSELYVWLAGVGELPTGLYHYDPAHHQLVQLRYGDFRLNLAEPLGLSPDELARTQLIIFATLRFNKNVPKYGDFSYRVQALDSGIVQGRLATLSQALGWPERLCWQFEVGPLHQLLGLNALREAVQHVTLLSGLAANPLPLPAQPSVVAPVDGKCNCSEAEPGLTERLEALQKAASATPPRRFAPPDPEPAPAPNPFALLPAIRNRYSNGSAFDGRPLPAGRLLDLARAGRQGLAGLRRSDTRLALQLYFLALRVEGLEQGVYRYNPTEDRLEQVRAEAGLNYALQAANFNFYVASFNPDKMAAVFYPVGDFATALQDYDDCAFRLLNLAAGWAVEQVQTAASGYGLDTANYLGYETGQVNQLLGLSQPETAHQKGWQTLMQLFIGTVRAGTPLYRGFLL